jgi:hypothetical protein
MKARSTAASATALIFLLAGCADDGTLSPSGVNTSSIEQQNKQASKSQDAVCLTLASQIEALNGEGVPDKVSKAAAKKYKLKPTDLAKADELNKANTEFQAKCSNFPPRPTVAAVTTEPTVTPAPATKVAAKTKPPLPAPKPAAAAVAPQASAPAATPAATPVADSSSMPAP